MLNSYDIEQNALEKLQTYRREADRARALRAGASVLHFREVFRKLIPASRVQARDCVPANLHAK